MSKKWQKVDPATLKVGDEVKVKHDCGDYKEATYAKVAYVSSPEIGVGPYNFYANMGTWFVRKPKPAKPHGDTSEGRTAKHWQARYLKQLQHTERLQEANRGRRQRMKLLKKEAEDARAQVQGWESRYAVLAASFTESNCHNAETQSQLDDAMLTIAEQRTELKNLRQVLADEQNSTPLTRPEEPPVGSFFKVDRTARLFYRFPMSSLTNYFHLGCDAGDRPWVAWADVTEPGDTITRLLLVEATDE